MKVKRFWVSPIDDDAMEPGVWYDSIPYDYDAADDEALRQFEAWKRENPDARIVSITGPVQQMVEDEERRNKYTKWVVLTVIYEPAMVAA